ncbi:hypothetical protein SAMN05421766_10442 [Zobellia uliginosa]|uniref:Uncharacterized protein n=1 Tax=Zobellia uliginosa TaxID=143224 RepID=A0ABY1KUF1_9FLAO|nr:hypothetical protein SAMN05421766_10442 [Zobellia uliginosa]
MGFFDIRGIKGIFQDSKGVAVGKFYVFIDQYA